MDDSLTLRDLLLPGEPLEGAELLAGHDQLARAVSWAVSLRPFSPAFPRLRGGELALVATEHVEKIDPPTTLADILHYLLTRDIAAVAVRGQVDERAIREADRGQLPLLLLPRDAPLHDIEQAIMRECALYQARREMQPADDPAHWVRMLLEGRTASLTEAQAAAHRQGHTLASLYSVLYLPILPPNDDTRLVEDLVKHAISQVANDSLSVSYRGGVAWVIPTLSDDDNQRGLSLALTPLGLPLGISTVRPPLELSAALQEAQVAAQASALMRNNAPTRFADLGADYLLLLLYDNWRNELQAFVERTLGPLLRHDARSASPLLPTLTAFVQHGGRLRETAAALYVHRNTLAYRLERAAQLLGVDLREQSSRLAIELALRALFLTGRSETVK